MRVKYLASVIRGLFHARYLYQSSLYILRLATLGVESNCKSHYRPPTIPADILIAPLAKLVVSLDKVSHKIPEIS